MAPSKHTIVRSLAQTSAKGGRNPPELAHPIDTRQTLQINKGLTRENYTHGRWFIIPIATMAIASMTGCEKRAQDAPSAELKGVEPAPPIALQSEDSRDPTANDPTILSDVVPPKDSDDALTSTRRNQLDRADLTENQLQLFYPRCFPHADRRQSGSACRIVQRTTAWVPPSVAAVS